MLNSIRSAIKRQSEMLESANIILEDAIQNLDDAIILGQTQSAPMYEGDEEDLKLPGEDGENETPVSKPESDEDDDDKDDHDDDDEDKEDKKDLLDEPDEPVEGTPEHEINTGNDDLLSDVDEPETPPAETLAPETAPEGSEQLTPEAGSDPLPEVGANPTGEPVVSSPDDLLTVEVNPSSGTVKDVLPVPPQGAGDMLAGDPESQHVDSGFGGEPPAAGDSILTEPSSDPETGEDLPAPAATPIPPEENKGTPGEEGDGIMNEPDESVPGTPTAPETESSAYSEAISLGGDDDGKEEPKEEPEQEEEKDGASGEEDDTEVTAAVKDKVAEAEGEQKEEEKPEAEPEAPAAGEEDVPEDPGVGDEPAAEPSGSVGSGAIGKDISVELMKRLGTFTKNLEDIKTMIMSSSQQG